MKLSEIFHHLTSGELAQLNIGGGELGSIQSANYNKILSHVNLGLTALYTRFPLKEKRLDIALQDGRISYPLTYDYAVTNPAVNSLPRFILDSVAAPFISDIIKVERIITDTDKELGLNDSSDAYSITTPSMFELRVPQAYVDSTLDLPTDLVTDNLEVVYRANHPILVYDAQTFNPATLEIELPYTHLQALLLFIASRLYNPIGMANEFHAGNSYAAKYEQACLLLEVKDVNVDQGGQNDRLQRGGWV